MVSQQASLIVRLAGSAGLAALLLSGCTAFSSTPSGAARPAAAGSRTAPPAAPGRESGGGSAEALEHPGNGASTALLEQARSEREAGSLVAAAAAVERALRIAPNDPDLWIELGEIKLAAGDREQAEMMARKALTLAGSDRAVAERANRLLTN
jgi:Flp pilus assembly protein TadD